MTERWPDNLSPALDSSGNVISGAKLNFYITGTSTRKDTYTTAAKSVANANPVIADSAGRFPDIFMDTDVAYKVVFTDAADVEIWTKNDVVPILPPGTFPIIAVSTKSTNYTALTTDRGADILVDASSGPVTITLLPVATALSGFVLTVVKLDSSANVVTVDANLAETINGATTIELGEQYGAFEIGTEGTLWYIKSEKRLPTPTVATADEIVTVNSAGTGYTTTSNPFPPAHLTGLVLSNNATDAVNDIDIAIGSARDTADTANLVLAAAVGKQLDVSWAAGGTPGTPTGGLSSSLTLTNDTDYNVFLGLVSGTAEVGFDTSLTGANLVTDHSFTNLRYIGFVRRDTALTRLFTQDGDHVQWDDPAEDINLTATLTTTARLDAISVPPGKKILADVGTLGIDAAGLVGYVSSPDANDEAPSSTVAPGYNIGLANATTAGAHRFWVRTDTSGQVRSRSNGATMDEYVLTTFGYIDRRGKDD